MRLPCYICIFTLVWIVSKDDVCVVEARKPIRPPPSGSVARTRLGPTNGRGGGGGSRGTAARQQPIKKRRVIVVEEDDIGEEIDEMDEEEEEYDDDDEEDDDDMDEIILPKPGPSQRMSNKQSKGRPASREVPLSRMARGAAVQVASKRKSTPPPRRRFEEFEDDEDDYDEYVERVARPPPRSKADLARHGRAPPQGGRGRAPPRRSGPVVPYGRPHQNAFTKSLAAIRSSIPDPETVKNKAFTSLKTARETTSSLSTNFYRDIKGLTSSELEQVMLRATRPDDSPVKNKHVERLVGVSYQISPRLDIYDAVLRKLWSKMAESDWRTTIKAVYILHRFSADGAPDHAASLKARLRELRRTRDPKRKDKFFNSKQLLAGDSSPENIKFRAFMSRYAHYVLLRAQCFGGMFDEISSIPKVAPVKKTKAGAEAQIKPITSTSLRSEHLEAAAMLLKAGVACQLKEGEDCENTAIATERVASDLIGLCSAVAIALNRVLKEKDLKGADVALLKKWCEFYKDELLPKTRAMVKKTSPKLDAYGLFLPSRMGTTVSNDLLEKGLSLQDDSASQSSLEGNDEESSEDSSTNLEKTRSSLDVAKENEEAVSAQAADDEDDKEPVNAKKKVAKKEVVAAEDDDEAEDEYEYEDEEYYDDEDY